MPRNKKPIENEPNVSTKRIKKDSKKNVCNDIGKGRNDFYVYGHYRLDTGEIFWIGKGVGKRAYTKNKRNPMWKNIANKRGYTVDILHNNLSENVAFEYERGLIQFYGRKNNNTGILANMTDGGEGVSGHIPSNETRIKLSSSLTGRAFTEDHRQKISKGLTGRTFSDGHKKNLSVARIGIKFSDEHKLKMSVSHTGKKFSDMHKLHKSMAQLGKKHSDSTKEKIGVRSRERVTSSETKKLLSSIRSKQWPPILSPGGVAYCPNNLKQFCIEHNICYSAIQKVYSGKNSHAGGWRLP